MRREIITDEQVELEIERLRESPEVKLGILERQLKGRRRRYLYSLRHLEKRGKQLAAEGVTCEALKKMADDLAADIDDDIANGGGDVCSY